MSAWQYPSSTTNYVDQLACWHHHMNIIKVNGHPLYVYVIMCTCWHVGIAALIIASCTLVHWHTDIVRIKAPTC